VDVVVVDSDFSWPRSFEVRGVLCRLTGRVWLDLSSGQFGVGVVVGRSTLRNYGS